MGTIYQVVVYGLRGEKMEVELCNTEEQFEKMTVLQLKEKIAERLPETAGLEALRLIFADKMLDGNDQLLSHFGIHQHSIIRISAFPQETNRPVYAPLDRTEMGTIYKVVLRRMMHGREMEVDLCNTKEQFEKMTVLQMKEKIAERLHLNPGVCACVCVCRCMCVCRCLVQTQRLIFAGRHLDVDHQLLSHVGIQHMSVIHVMDRLRGGGSCLCPCGGMGDKGGKNQSMESLALFSKSTLD